MVNFLPMPKRDLPKLIIADSERDADMLYATRFFVPDAFLLLEQNGRRTIALSDLEVDRGRSSARVDEVLSITDELKRLGLRKSTPYGKFAGAFLRSRKVRRALVPATFPVAMAQALAREGVSVVPAKGLLFQERIRKTEEELKLLRQAMAITETGLARAMEVLGAAEIGRNRELRWSGQALTSELLRAEIDSAVLRAGGMPANTIVAGGVQACDPHERGSGPLRANELIIIDIFPRSVRSGYYGDMTRTVVRGRATEAQRHLWETVRAGQKMALSAMKAGADGKKIHESVKTFFKEQGFPTEQHEGRWRGFFHGTGHSLGLDLHEEPRFGKCIMQAGQVLTVEPGIYWPGVGGARQEDVAAVTEEGVRILSKFPKVLEL
jgi:Xaa-Pro aminopeptidase